MKRRTFLASTIAVAAANAAASKPDAAPAIAITDTNVYLGTWPFRTLSGEHPAALAAKLMRNDVHTAWAASFAGILHRDIAAANAALVTSCKEMHGIECIPIGTINPMLPAWRGDVKRCVQQHGMKIVRLHPNYHGYKLDDAIFTELLAELTAQKLRIQIVAQLEDERTQHPLVQVKPVDLKPLPALLDQHTEARVMVLNANSAMILSALHGCTRVWLDCAMIEAVGGIEVLLKTWPQDKLCFGSHAPLFYPESSRLKLQESELSAAQMQAVTHDNAAAFLG